MTRRSEVRTSITHPIYVDWLDAPSRVGMTLGPGIRASSTGGFRWERDLDADLEVLHKAGTTALVCLLEDEEFVQYGIPDLIPKAESRGLEVLRLPIRDQRVPHGLEEVDALLDKMSVHEANGGKLVIHCRGGLGRTGTIAGCYLVRNGRSPAEAIAILHRVRKSDRCPENARQESFIERYAKHLGTRRPTPAVAPLLNELQKHFKPAGRDPKLARVQFPPEALVEASMSMGDQRREQEARQAKSSEPAAPGSSWYATALGGLAAVEQAATTTGSKSAVAELLAKIEHEVAASPEACFAFADTGEATLTAAGRTFAAGRFTTPTIGELRARALARPRNAGGRLVLSVLHGAHPLTDIGTLQATAPPDTLFQVASQFNCLEAPRPHIVPVLDYVHDNTQGPRASVSAFPGTYLRHYRAPAADGKRFVQTDKRCLDLLGEVVDAKVAEVCSGYLQTSQVHDMGALAKALVASFDQVRVGVHSGVEVVFGHDWSGPVPNPPPRIAQVFTSTMALGGYGHDERSATLFTARRQLLRAAYLGTLLAALELESDSVVLTMIGGGVFGNPHRDIWDAIHWALAEVEPLASGTKQVLVNTREPVADADRAQVRARGGVFVEFSGAKIEVLR